MPANSKSKISHEIEKLLVALQEEIRYSLDTKLMLQFAFLKEKKSLRRPKAACIQGRSPNWKARGLTRRPSKPTPDTASLGGSQKKI
eukprot:1149816-Pelagomonas_calceolata.AAC.12